MKSQLLYFEESFPENSGSKKHISWKAYKAFFATKIRLFIFDRPSWQMLEVLVQKKIRIFKFNSIHSVDLITRFKHLLLFGKC